MTEQVSLRAVTLDCPDPKALGEFYQKLTGWEMVYSDDDFVGLATEGGLWIGFQRVADYRAPEWPSQSVPQQFHLDFGVADLDEAESRILAMGAEKAKEQPNEERWRVFTDPAGHPFCTSAM
ncbi:catechol 2,3-dioxygenase-like lactoylglutathione lyase family enzyme [Actinopolyspora lacussalsi]|nr:catechol 2,3-dioxygenase-like lactoylglutathione lyase family enzyme [Actinopolyspora lacussalsi]